MSKAPYQRPSVRAPSTAAAAVMVVWAAMSHSAAQTPAASGGPSFSSDGVLAKPADYREWPFVTAGLGMTYGPAQAAKEHFEINPAIKARILALCEEE